MAKRLSKKEIAVALRAKVVDELFFSDDFRQEMHLPFSSAGWYSDTGDTFGQHIRAIAYLSNQSACSASNSHHEPDCYVRGWLTVDRDSDTKSRMNLNDEKTSPQTPRQKIKREKLKPFCVFCKNNGEPEYVYNAHTTRDVYNRVLCAKLRSYECPTCGATGDNAHTLKYCPRKPIVTMPTIDQDMNSDSLRDLLNYGQQKVLK